MPSTLEATILCCLSILSQYDSLKVRDSRRGEKEPQICPESRLHKGMFLSREPHVVNLDLGKI